MLLTQPWGLANFHACPNLPAGAESHTSTDSSLSRFQDQRCQKWLRKPLVSSRSHHPLSNINIARIQAHLFNCDDFEGMPDKAGHPAVVPIPSKLLESLSPFTRACMKTNFGRRASKCSEAKQAPDEVDADNTDSVDKRTHQSDSIATQKSSKTEPS